MENNHGFILINKPVGPTSHDMIDKLRRITGIKKIGHAGTLDPFASGLLVVAIGRTATREISRYVKLDKEYIATLRLGAVSDTFDRTGKIIVNSEPSSGYPELGSESINAVLQKFTGPQKQTPPMYSAKKIKGKKLYELARKGIEVDREPSDIKVYELELIKYDWPNLVIKTKCSSGTYIRSLAHDIGGSLGCGAYLEELERIAVGEFRLEKAIDLKNLNQDNWEEYLFTAIGKIGIK